MKKIFLLTFLMVTLFLTAGCIVSFAPSDLFITAEVGKTADFSISVYPTPPVSIEWELRKAVSGNILKSAQNTSTFQFTPSSANAGELLKLIVVETYLIDQPPTSIDGTNTVTWFIAVQD